MPVKMASEVAQEILRLGLALRLLANLTNGVQMLLRLLIVHIGVLVKSMAPKFGRRLYVRLECGAVSPRTFVGLSMRAVVQVFGFV
jgi:hypothetical protein